VRVTVDPPQSFADEHTLIAQRYAGFFLGHPYRAAQQRVGPGAIQIDTTKAWREPAVTADDCALCVHMTDDDVVRRVAGYQHAIDIEVLRPHSLAYSVWLGAGTVDAEEAGELKTRAAAASQENRRHFIEQNPATLHVQPLSMVGLPLRLKRKLCIEWNHLYRDWMRAQPDIEYDFEARTFYREVEPQEPPAEARARWWLGYVPDARDGQGAA
jgi:hypothetical protein